MLLPFCSTLYNAHFSQKLQEKVECETDNFLSLFIVFVSAPFPILPLRPDRIISPVLLTLLFYLSDFSHLIVRMPFCVAILFLQKTTCNFLTQGNWHVHGYHQCVSLEKLLQIPSWILWLHCWTRVIGLHVYFVLTTGCFNFFYICAILNVWNRRCGSI